MESFTLGLTLLVTNLCGLLCLAICIDFIRHAKTTLVKALAAILPIILLFLIALLWLPFPYLSGQLIPESAETFLAFGVYVLTVITITGITSILLSLHAYQKTHKIKIALFIFALFGILLTGILALLLQHNF